MSPVLRSNNDQSPGRSRQNIYLWQLKTHIIINQGPFFPIQPNPLHIVSQPAERNSLDPHARWVAMWPLLQHLTGTGQTDRLTMINVCCGHLVDNHRMSGKSYTHWHRYTQNVSSSIRHIFAQNKTNNLIDRYTIHDGRCHKPISFFSWMNLTFPSASEASSIAWLNPFSPPYETSTIFITLACNRYNQRTQCQRQRRPNAAVRHSGKR